MKTQTVGEYFGNEALKEANKIRKRLGLPLVEIEVIKNGNN